MRSKTNLIILPALYVGVTTLIFFVLGNSLKDQLLIYYQSFLLGYLFGAWEYKKFKGNKGHILFMTRKAPQIIIAAVVVVLFTFTLFLPVIYNLFEHNIEESLRYLLPIITTFWSAYQVTILIYRYKNGEVAGSSP